MSDVDQALREHARRLGVPDEHVEAALDELARFLTAQCCPSDIDPGAAIVTGFLRGFRQRLEAPPEPIEPPPDSVPAKESFGLDYWTKKMAPTAGDPPDLADPDGEFGMSAMLAGVPNERLPDALAALEAAMLASLTPAEVDALVYTSEPVTRFLRAAARSFNEPPN